jgi:hypothetical protein
MAEPPIDDPPPEPPLVPPPVPAAASPVPAGLEQPVIPADIPKISVESNLARMRRAVAPEHHFRPE